MSAADRPDNRLRGGEQLGSGVSFDNYRVTERDDVLALQYETGGTQMDLAAISRDADPFLSGTDDDLAVGGWLAAEAGRRLGLVGTGAHQRASTTRSSRTASCDWTGRCTGRICRRRGWQPTSGTSVGGSTRRSSCDCCRAAPFRTRGDANPRRDRIDAIQSAQHQPRLRRRLHDCRDCLELESGQAEFPLLAPWLFHCLRHGFASAVIAGGADQGHVASK